MLNTGRVSCSVSGPASSLLWWKCVGDGTEDVSEEDVIEGIDEFGDEQLNELFKYSSGIPSSEESTERSGMRRLCICLALSGALVVLI